MSRMFFFGFGYSAGYLARLLHAEGWNMAGTTRSQEKVNSMWEQGVEPHIWTGEAPLEGPMRVMRNVTHVLHTLPPGPKGDLVLRNHNALLAKIAPNLEWYGYISTTAVYGDTHGEAATEDFAPNPSTQRGKVRLRIENRHRQLFKKRKLPLHIFRAGAIYGPGRSAIRRAAQGAQRMIHKEGHTTCRIHVEDLAQILRASMARPNPGSVYNCVDDLPTGLEEPLDYAYEMLDKPKPPVVEYDEVRDEISERMDSFFSEARLVSNDRIKSELGVELKYPTYKEGYQAINKEREGAAETG